MAKVEYIDILPGLENAYFSGIRSDDRFVHSRVAKKIAIFSRKKKTGVSQRSLLPQIAALWAGFSGDEKAAWNAAAAAQKDVLGISPPPTYGSLFGISVFGEAIFGDYISGSNASGWQLFVQDMCARIYNDMAGVATPSLLHQSWVGNLKIEAPASEIKIVQIHPRFYWISRKVTHKKGMYEPVGITEDLALPFVLSLNYKSDLVSTGPGSFAKLYARFWHSYQGADQYTDLEIPFDFVSDWKNATATLTTLLGYVIRYDLYFHLYNLTGDLYFDNLNVEHSSQNWARDPFCKDILQGFTRAFYQIPDHWAAVILPDGSMFDSIYKDF